jgi:predicted SAM-dependent methyltransferase
LTFHLGSLGDRRFPDEEFDAVTMSHSLEHVHDPVAWLREARRIIKPDGQLTIATPNARSLLHRKFGADWFALEPPRHLHIFNRLALGAALRQAGFERFVIFTSIRDVNGAWHGSRSIRRSGRHDMLVPPPHAIRFAGRLVQLGVGIRKIFDPDAGEELVAVVQR